MERTHWRHFDPLLVLATGALMALGLATLYSATYAVVPEGSSWLDQPVARQALYALFGIALAVLAAAVDYRLYRSTAYLLYAGVVVVLGLLFATGQLLHGARRWIDLTVVVVQPSEIGKLILIIALARFLSSRERRSTWGYLLTSLGLAVLPGALVFLEPDLGTSLTYLALWLTMALMAGASLWKLAALGGAGLLALPALYVYGLAPYMRERLVTFLDPYRDPLGSSYTVLQSEISVGSGGFWGKGFLQGTQTQLRFLRVQQTDFIFSVLGEELGFVGAMLLFGLFLLLLFRGIRVASLARDDFGRLAACGIVAMVAVQVFIHVGVGTRLLPVTGMPLPFISAGGSSLVTNLLAVGILEGIVTRQRRLEF